MNLLESLICILDEGKRGDYIIANFASLIDPLYKKFESDHSFDMNVIEDKAKKILKSRETGEMSEEDSKKEVLRIILDEIENKFPLIRKNLAWVMRQYANNQFLFEDYPRVEGYLEKFEKAKNKKKIENTDINKYDYTTFRDTLNDISDDELKSDKDRRKEVQQAINAEDPTEVKSKDFEIVWKTPELIVFHPFTYDGEVACVPTVDKNGRPCEWCTRASREATRWGTNGEGYFNNYSKDGPLFPMHDLVNDEWYQLHFESDQFKNWKDEEVDRGSSEQLDRFLEKRPYIKEFISDYVNKHPMIAKKYRRWGRFLDKSKLDPELADWFAYSGSNLDYVKEMNEEGKEITEKTKKMIIDSDPILITRLKSPSVELQQLALNKNPHAFRRSCPEEIRKLAIEKDPQNLTAFDEFKVKVNGEVKTLTANDVLTDEDVKMALAGKPEIIVTILNDDNFSKFQTEEMIKYAIEKDHEKEYPNKIHYQFYNRLSDDMKKWVDQLYGEK